MTITRECQMLHEADSHSAPRRGLASESAAAPASQDAPFFGGALSQLGILSQRDADRLPTFMVVAPPKTGTTWLFAILQKHPQVTVPTEKETHFFSSYYKWCDLSWYLSRFGDKPAAQRGEATPTYAILPPRIIRTIHALLPDLKLIFLMRDPVERAWSHARHNWRYEEANFSGGRPPLEQMSDDLWRENFCHPWPSISGDYLGQLRRWRSFFPRKQIYVAFFEQIVSQPKELLGEVCDFLGMPSCEDSQLPLGERVNEGLSIDLSPSLRAKLQAIYSARTRQLADYLWSEFQVRIPSEWSTGHAADNAPPPSLAGPMRVAAEHEFDDDFLFDVVRHEQRPEAPWDLREAYLDFNLYLFRNRVYALAVHVGPEFLTSATPSEMEAAQYRGHCLQGESIREVKERIAHVLLHRPMGLQLL